jgi:hypothetical protein
MEKMEKFWKLGVKMWDEYRRETFTLKAIIIVTINDYAALFSLSGQKNRKNRLCSLFEWYNICEPERISEGSVCGAQTLANKDSQVP